MVSLGGSSEMMMSTGSMPSTATMGANENMAGVSWVWCGAQWVTMPGPVWGWPC
jgi:hypothetical protein